jgi:hypothetical protein
MHAHPHPTHLAQCCHNQLDFYYGCKLRVQNPFEVVT